MFGKDQIIVNVCNQYGPAFQCHTHTHTPTCGAQYHVQLVANVCVEFTFIFIRFDINKRKIPKDMNIALRIASVYALI